MRCLLAVALAIIAFPSCGRARPEAPSIAVARNFLEPAEALAAAHAARSGAEIRLAAGSTGALYAQIRQGAPFDALLAADAERPRRLEAEGLAVPGSRFAYALGRLVLWSRRPGFVPEDGAELLRRGGFRRLALANPELAPYGAAALEALEALGLRKRLEPEIVRGMDVGQAFQLAATGSADLALVALSQVRAGEPPAEGSSWVVPERLHGPIRQEAVLLAAGRRGARTAEAGAFLAFVRSAEGRGIIAAFGYDLPDP